MTNDEFITRIRNKYPTKNWDLSRTVYDGVRNPVIIRCCEKNKDGVEHGEFEVIPNSILYRDTIGCPECDRQQRERNFISEVKAKFPDANWDLSTVHYINNYTEVEIRCQEKDENGVEHGVFKVMPRQLLHDSQHGCQKCAAEAKKKTTNQFKIELMEKHPDADLDLSLVKYINGYTYVRLICNKIDRNGEKHGVFEARPNNLLHSVYACPICAREAQTKTTEQFIRDARKVHGDRYDYSRAKYKNWETPLEIICPVHGSFWQKPNSHVSGGNGCPKCAQSRFEERTSLLLGKHGITYIYQCGKRHFEWLGRRELDFYLPHYHAAIECQGQQHFYPVDFAGKGEEWAKEKFHHVQQLDQEKKELCEIHGIRIFYIKYDEPTENAVERILTELNTIVT